MSAEPEYIVSVANFNSDPDEPEWAIRYRRVRRSWLRIALRNLFAQGYDKASIFVQRIELRLAP